MTKQTGHARDQRDDEATDETEMKVPEKVTAKAAVDQMIKATRRMVKQRGLDPN